MFALKEIIQHYPHENSKVLHNLQEQLLIIAEYLNDLTNNSKIYRFAPLISLRIDMF